MSAHYYNKEGQLVDGWEDGAWPSPTTILDILPKPELEAWRRVQGENLADELMTAAQERGTRVHKACEIWLADSDYLTASAGLLDKEIIYLDGFINWWFDDNVELIESEIFLESSKYKFRGRCDLVVTLNGEPWIIDLKTGIKRWTHDYQLRFYQQAYYEMTGVKCRMGVLGLTDKNKCGFRKLKEVNKPIYKMVALRLLFSDFMKHNPIKAPREESTVWEG